jgi:hypothetical protein
MLILLRIMLLKCPSLDVCSVLGCLTLEGGLTIVLLGFYTLGIMSRRLRPKQIWIQPNSLPTANNWGIKYPIPDMVPPLLAEGGRTTNLKELNPDMTCISPFLPPQRPRVGKI